MKPMLAAKDIDKNLEQIRFPVLCSPKMDGIRCLIKDGVAMSRKLIPIPSRCVQSMIAHTAYNGLDGELIVGPPNAENVYNQTYRGVMSQNGDPSFTFYVFDDYTSSARFHARSVKLKLGEFPAPIHYWPHQLIYSVEELLAYEAQQLTNGYEGVIGRSLDGLYKFGRSTLKEQGMWKLKRFVDSEAEILEWIELEHNTNEAGEDALGNTKRSSAQAGKVGGGTLGAWRVRDIHTHVEFNIGMFKGLTAADKQKLWDGRERFNAQSTFVKYSSFPVGVKDAPRHAKFIGWRSSADL